MPVRIKDQILAQSPFEGKNKGPHVLISAGVHGDEYEPVLAAFELISQLGGNLLLAGEVTIVPIVNTSAFECNSRYGSDGLDLARICPGKTEGTPSEECAAAISELIARSDYYIDMHTGGRLFEIYPLAGYMLHSSSSVLQRQRMMAEAFQLPVIWGTDSTPDGRTLSVARDANVPSIYVEFGGGGMASDAIVSAYVEGCLNVLSALGMVQKRQHDDIKKYRVEDYTPQSGHLQAKMPAPVDGIFVPLVKTGNRVKKGELWGYITDPDNGKKNCIYTETEGLVLFLRVSASVNRGDSLGGVLPVLENEKMLVIK